MGAGVFGGSGGSPGGIFGTLGRRGPQGNPSLGNMFPGQPGGDLGMPRQPVAMPPVQGPQQMMGGAFRGMHPMTGDAGSMGGLANAIRNIVASRRGGG